MKFTSLKGITAGVDALRADLTTGALAGLLVAVGAALLPGLPSGRILEFAPLVSPGVLLVCLFAAFILTELTPLHIELRQATYSFSLSGIALVLGILFGEALPVVLVRVLAAAVVFAIQRPAPIKAFYNLAAYLFEASLIATVLHLVLGEQTPVDLRLALVCGAISFCVDLLMTALVLGVIWLHSQRFSWRQASAAVTSVTGMCLFGTSTTIAVVIFVDEGGALAVLLITSFALLGISAYVGYLRLRHRHQSLAAVHEFVQQGSGASGVRELAQTLLVHIRQLLRAGRLEVTVFDYHDMGDRLVSVNRDDVYRSDPLTSAPDWLLTRVMDSRQSLVIARGTRDPELRKWLRERGARDAVIVPLPSPAVRGCIVLTDRIGDAGTFTDDDVTMLQTLAGHLVMSLRGARLVEQLRHDATHDALTGLANRVFLHERVETALADQAQEESCAAAVLLVDLDKFKEVNDAFGHHVGDALLQEVARRLTEQVGDSGVVARLGGDEFAVLVVGPGAAQTADVVARRVLEALGGPITLVEAVVTTRASIGIGIATAGLSSADLLRQADIAMYMAKEGPEPVVVYGEHLDRGRSERLRLLADLHLALERQEIQVLFQPQLDLRSGTIRSVEALARWQHPVLGPISPDTFIPLAESSGLIGPLTQQVLDRALSQVRLWHEAGLDLSVAVNLSPHNVSNMLLVEDVAGALERAGVAAGHLILEITESGVMADPARTVPLLRRLAGLGVTLSLDDFGTGYSSLAYLQRLPVSEVKIDKSFVMGLNDPSQAHASSVLIRSILTLSANLGLRVVAEGVEDAAGLEQLRAAGCDLIQGYFVARPVPAEQVAAIVAQQSLTDQNFCAWV